MADDDDFGGRDNMDLVNDDIDPEPYIEDGVIINFSCSGFFKSNLLSMLQSWMN